VTRDSEMQGRVCMITGATHGIGLAAAHALARRGASLVLVGRNRERGEAVVDEVRRRSGNRDVELLIADLSLQAEVERLASEFLAADRPLHVLLNNAGVVNIRRIETREGREATFALNHLAYFLLTLRLLDRLKESAPARVVSVASDAHAQARGPLDLDDLDSRKSYSGMRVYGRTKLANILFTRELARRLEGSGVTANCLHPGFVGSNFARNNGIIATAVMALLSPFIRSPEKGAETAVYLASSPEVEGVSGEYFMDCRIAKPKSYARDDDDARALWQASERVLGL